MATTETLIAKHRHESIVTVSMLTLAVPKCSLTEPKKIKELFFLLPYTTVCFWSFDTTKLLNYKQISLSYYVASFLQYPPSYLKRMRRVVHTVDPEGETQRVAGVRTAKHSQPQPLGRLLVQRLPHQGVATRMLQQHMAPLGLQQTVAGRALLIHWHHFLWREETSGETRFGSAALSTYSLDHEKNSILEGRLAAHSWFWGFSTQLYAAALLPDY